MPESFSGCWLWLAGINSRKSLTLAVAKAQGVLLRATQQLLKRDKWDGIRASKWLAKHDELYREIADDYHDMLDDDQRAKAAKLAGEPDTGL